MCNCTVLQGFNKFSMFVKFWEKYFLQRGFSLAAISY